MKEWLRRRLKGCVTREECINALSREMTITANKIDEYKDRLNDEIHALRELNADKSEMPVYTE